MLVRETDKIFRCDDACCKNFATYEIVVGGATGKL